MIAVLIENAARLSVPFLVRSGIDSGIPPIVGDRRRRTLLAIVGARAAGGGDPGHHPDHVPACCPAGSASRCCSTLRRRVFPHFQKLSPAFHDEYTSGRVISRQTSDIDAIYELLETGFDGLITAVLTLVGTAVLLLVLDVKLGLVALLCFPFLLVLTRWFRRESAQGLPAYPRDRRASSSSTSSRRSTACAPCRPSAASRATRRSSTTSTTTTALANERAFRLVGLFMPGIKLIGNITIAVVSSTAPCSRIDGEVTSGVLAAFLLYLRQFFEPMQEISQFYNTFQSASAALEKLSGVLEEEPSVAAADQAGPAATTRAASCTSTTSGSRTSPTGRCCPTSTSRSRRA